MMQIEKIMRYRRRNDKGFTLIEIIAVLVIIAIISAVAISRVTGTDTAKLQAEVDTLKGHLRYAQYLALNANDGGNDLTALDPATLTVKWGIRIDGNSYTLIINVNNGAFTTHSLSLPNESSATHYFLAPINATGTGVLFDEWGSPYSGSTKLTGGAPITIATFTPGPQSITITPETGFIP